jgi:hypothetical protein
MSLKKLIIAMTTVVLIFFGNIIYYFMQQIEGPIFLNHYYEYQFQQDEFTQVDLFYVTNKNQELLHIDVPGVEYSSIKFISDYQILKHYQVKKVSLELNVEDLKEDIAFSNIHARFSDSDYQQYDIGEIRLRPSSYGKKEQPFTWVSSGSSSDHTSYSIFDIKEDSNLIEVQIPFQNLLQDQLQLMLDVNGEEVKVFKEKFQSDLDRDYEIDTDKMFEQSGVEVSSVTYPMPIEKNDSLKVSSSFRFNEGSIHRTSIFQFEYRLLFEYEDGSKWFAKDFLHYQPYFSSSDIKRITKKDGGIGE